MGQGQDANYFRSGEAGYHKQWDSRILNYGHWEVRICYMTVLLPVTFQSVLLRGSGVCCTQEVCASWAMVHCRPRDA
jgi:hypothetical protein